jgi:predicted kinase
MENLWTSPLCPAPGQALDWDALDATLPWVRNMRHVAQSPVHHAEGDVWIHTRMVVQSLLDLPAYQALSAHKRSVLFWAAMAHDISKPECTYTDDDGNIVSPRHAVKGRILWRVEAYAGFPKGVPFAVREEVAHLVRYHGLPLWFLQKHDLQALVIKASQLMDLQMLALLAEADVRGRICHDQDDLLYRVDLFREYCKEQGVWDGPWQFKNNHARFQYFHNPSNGLLYEPYDDYRGTAILMSGLPGSGKDTWIAKNHPDWPVVSLDDLRSEFDISPKDKQGFIINAAKERAKEYLRKGENFIWNATNIIPAIRGPLIAMFQEYKARTCIVHVEVPYKRMLAQNASRKAKVPDKIMAKMLHKWEVPEIWEAPEVLYVVVD